MDQVVSARLDVEVAQEIGRLALALHTTRKDVLERAIREFAARAAPEERVDPLVATCGAWQRDEPPDETVRAVRARSRATFSRRKA